MTLKFYKYAGTRNTVNKRAELALLTPLTVSSDRVAGDQDLENIVLHVTASENTLSGYNYVYIQDWERYYFIIKMTWLADGIYNITCEEDYLNTWCVKAGANTSYGGIAKYSGLGDSNLQDPRITFKPEATINRFEMQRSDPSSQYSNNLFCLRFYSVSPFITGESPGIYVGTGVSENAVFLSSASLSAFLFNYANLSEPNRVAVGKSLISISFVPLPGYINANAHTVTGIRIETPFTSTPVEISVESGTPALDYARLIYSPEMVYTAITPVEYQAVSGTPSTIHTFNSNNRFWELHAIYTLKHPGLQPIKIDPAAYGKKSSFNIKYKIGYEPFSDQYIINLFPDVQSGKYTPIIQPNRLTVPFIVDNSLQQTGLSNLTSILSATRSTLGGISSIMNGIMSQNYLGAAGGAVDIASSLISSGMAADRLMLSEQVGYSVSGINGIAMFYPDGIFEPGPHLYQAYNQPVDTFWSNLGKPDGQRRSIFALAGSGYAELQIINPPALDGATYNELLNFNALCAQGVIF